MMLPVALLLLTLTACGEQSDDALALEISTAYQEMQQCSGEATITSDYGDRIYEYQLSFTYEREGDLVLNLTAPDTVQGITARIVKGETALEFEGIALETGPLSADGLSPIDCIPATLTYIQEGYLSSCGRETLGEVECLRLQFRNPEVQSGEGAEGIIWVQAESGDLVQSEMLYNGITVVRCVFTSMTKG